MTREERRRLLGDECIAHIHQCVADAPAAPADLVDSLRRILTRPARTADVTPVERAA
ncbi:hypothetical protein [Streptomyces sp. NPDC058603]|uniref:hypothetical protein n=1 Tax=Streptomyces sp. NPDC058603 TaxID=3346551 RepID=UPI003660EE83